MFAEVQRCDKEIEHQQKFQIQPYNRETKLEAK